MSRGPVFVVRQADPPGGRQLRRLVTGVVHRSDDGRILLERPGPFTPPIALPSVGLMVVTAGVRAEVDAAGLTGLRWVPVVKHHIAALDWHPVPNDARRLALPVPDPDGFLVRAPHDEHAADALGALWCAHIRSVPTDGPFDVDVFRVAERAWIFVSERARTVLEAEAGGWLDFEPALMR